MMYMHRKLELKEFQDQKKIEDMITVKLEVDQIGSDMLNESGADVQKIEQHKSELEARIS